MLKLHVLSNLHPFVKKSLIVSESTTIASIFDMYIKETQEKLRIYPIMVSVNGRLINKIYSKISELVETEDEKNPTVMIYFRFQIPCDRDPYTILSETITNAPSAIQESRGLLTEVFAFINSNFRMDGVSLRTKIFLLLLLVYTNMRYSGNFNLLLLICFIFWMSALNVIQDHVNRFRDLFMKYVDKVDEALKQRFFSHLNNEENEQASDGQETEDEKNRLYVFFEDVGIWIVGFFYSLNPMWSM